MIDLETFKAALIKGGATTLSEEEILKLRERMDKLAEIIFVMWLGHINSNRKN